MHGLQIQPYPFPLSANLDRASIGDSMSRESWDPCNVDFSLHAKSREFKRQFVCREQAKGRSIVASILVPVETT